MEVIRTTANELDQKLISLFTSHNTRTCQQRHKNLFFVHLVSRNKRTTMTKSCFTTWGWQILWTKGNMKKREKKLKGNTCSILPLNHGLSKDVWCVCLWACKCIKKQKLWLFSLPSPNFPVSCFSWLYGTEGIYNFRITYNQVSQSSWPMPKLD